VSQHQFVEHDHDIIIARKAGIEEHGVPDFPTCPAHTREKTSEKVPVVFPDVSNFIVPLVDVGDYSEEPLGLRRTIATIPINLEPDQICPIQISGFECYNHATCGEIMLGN